MDSTDAILNALRKSEDDTSKKANNDYQEFVKANYRSVADELRVPGDKQERGAIMKEISKRWHQKNGTTAPPKSLKDQIEGGSKKKKKKDVWQSLSVGVVNKYLKQAKLVPHINGGNLKTATKKQKIEIMKAHVRHHASKSA